MEASYLTKKIVNMTLEISFSEDYALVFQQQIRAFREKLDLESKSRARDEDRISQLPDAVLCHILSFIPSTKCVVRTSILSTRWKDIWASVPNLYFDNKEFSSYADFVAFVDHSLLIRGDLSSIQDFYLYLGRYHYVDCSRICSWICTAIRCNVVGLYLSVDSYFRDDLFELPESISTCKTLKVLSLMSRFIVNMPTLGCFPSLKFLYIHFRVYDCDKTSLDLSHFPVLEHLNIDVSVGRFPFNINISVPELKTLRISLDSTIFFSHPIYNVFIDAPKLEKLYVKEDSLSNFNLKNTQSLVEADINIYVHHSDDDKPVAAAAYAADHAARAARATEFLAGISMVKYFSFSWHISEACSVPAFNNLSKLTLVHNSYYQWWKVLMKLLQRSPNLEYLVIDDRFYQGQRVEFHLTEEDEIELTKEVLKWSEPESVPNCLLSHLNTICIKGFKGKYVGYLEEVELTKYLLKNGRVLEKMTIDYSTAPGLFRVTKEEIYNEISMVEWGSKTVQVEMIEVEDRR